MKKKGKGNPNSTVKNFKKDGKKKEDPPPVQLSATSSAIPRDDHTPVHPIAIGINILVLYRDGSHRTAKVIERAPNSAKWQYYVHYHDFNRRMDEWIDESRILQCNITVADPHHSHGQDHADEVGHKRERDGENEASESKVSGAITTIAELGYDEHEDLDEASLLEHEEITKIKNIRHVLFGRYKLECWYFSPFPKEYHPNGPVDCLFFCEFTFRFFRTKDELVRFQSQPLLPRHPPGSEIYRDSRVSMFELDGAVEKIYCQNLCYFAKLFLDHKVTSYLRF